MAISKRTKPWISASAHRGREVQVMNQFDKIKSIVTLNAEAKRRMAYEYTQNLLEKEWIDPDRMSVSGKARWREASAPLPFSGSLARESLPSTDPFSNLQERQADSSPTKEVNMERYDPVDPLKGLIIKSPNSMVDSEYCVQLAAMWAKRTLRFYKSIQPVELTMIPYVMNEDGTMSKDTLWSTFGEGASWLPATLKAKILSLKKDASIEEIQLTFGMFPATGIRFAGQVISGESVSWFWQCKCPELVRGGEFCGHIKYAIKTGMDSIFLTSYLERGPEGSVLYQHPLDGVGTTFGTFRLIKHEYGLELDPPCEVALVIDNFGGPDDSSRIMYLTLDFLPTNPTGAQLVASAAEAYRAWLFDTYGVNVVCPACGGEPTESSHDEVVSIACTNVCLQCNLNMTNDEATWPTDINSAIPEA